MRVVFRADASVDIGNGHVMRCLTLAIELREQGSTCLFICRQHEGNLIEKIRKFGFDVEVLQIAISKNEMNMNCDIRIGTDWTTDAQQTLEVIGSDVDWVVVDHYAIDKNWESFIRRRKCKLLVIDDLANRPHEADLLVDQNMGRKDFDYQSLVNENCQILTGPQYAIIRSEFVAHRELSLQRQRNELRHILVSMGGVDKDNVTGEVLDQLKTCAVPPSLTITVVLGPHAPHITYVRQMASRMPWPTKVLVDVDDMAGLMAQSDLAIGAAGGSALERCCVGLPSIIIPVADNQIAGARALAMQGGAILASLDPLGAPKLSDAVAGLFGRQELCASSLGSSSTTDGGGAKRIVRLMQEKSSPRLRPMRETDLDQVLLWRNTPEIRHYMINSEPISNKSHIEWFRSSCINPDRELLIAELNGHPFGFVQFSGLQDMLNTEWGFYVAPNARKGSGTLLGKLALEYAFRKLRIPRLIGHVLAMNQVSIGFHEKFGFRYQGSCKDSPNETDLLTFELWREEWESTNGVVA
jgi:UDP-2,4-diacetamido-2,4,6-trideoxy-beta-L-altropyranose hydrolase